MTVFWIIVACLVAASLLFVIPPMFQRRENAEEVDRKAVNISIYKNQLVELSNEFHSGEISEEQYQLTKSEIERRLLDDAEKNKDVAAGLSDDKEYSGLSKITSVFVIIAIPLLTLGMYSKVGTPEGLDPAAAIMVQEDSPHGGENNMAMQIEAMVGQLSERLQKDPTDIEGWVMLGRSLNVLGRYDQAVVAFSRAVQFTAEDPDVLADYADALAMASGTESLDGEPLRLLQEAVVLDPFHQKSLWLLGTAMFEKGDFRAAIDYWTRLQNQLQPGSEDANVMRANIQEAHKYQGRKERGDFGAYDPASESISQSDMATASAAPAASSRITGSVSLAPELLDQASANDTLFIFARAVSGPPMPLAIIRAQVKDLPMEFSLDETMAMMPAMSLAKFPEVVVGARISKTGDAMAQSGDMQALSGTVTVGTDGIKLIIDSIVP